MATSSKNSLEIIKDNSQKENLVFKNNGKLVVITPAKIAELFGKTKDTQVHSTDKEFMSNYGAMQILSQHGLKSALDVINFLKSPHGQITQKLIQDHLVLLAAIANYQSQQQQDLQLLKQRFLAFIILTIIHKKQAHAKELDAIIREQLATTLNRAKTSTEKAVLSYTDIQEPHLLDQIYAAHLMSSQLLEGAIQQKLLEAQELEVEIAALEQEGERIRQRITIFEFHLQRLDVQADEIEAEMEGQPEALAIERIEQSIARVHEQIQHAEEEAKAINYGQDPSKLFDKLHGLNIESLGLTDILAAYKKEKIYYDEKAVVVNSYSKAAFIISSKKELFLDPDGNLYLLEQGQDFTSMSTEEKTAAKQHFEHLKPEITSIKQHTRNNIGVETALYEKKRMDTSARNDSMQNDILNLTNQFNQVQAAQASTAALIMERSSSAATVPTPRPTPHVQMKTSQKTPHFSTSQSYKQVLELMKKDPTQKSIDRLRNGLVLANGQPNQKLQAEVDKIVPGRPISPAKMASLLKNMESFGRTAYAPGIATSASPSPFQKRPTPNPYNK